MELEVSAADPDENPVVLLFLEVFDFVPDQVLERVDLEYQNLLLNQLLDQPDVQLG